MEKNNKKKNDQLGMSYGTAMNRLRKLMTLHLLQKFGEDICYVCKNPIETVEELSIEHKIPWQDNSNDLFWDLNNIAFSHLRCNRPHLLAKRRGMAPPGTTWCHGCNDYIKESEFYVEKIRWNGLRPRCKKCVNEANKRRRSK